MKPIRIIIADDHPLFRKGLVAALTEFKTIEIVNQAENGKELLAVLSKTPCDVVILDLKMPMIDGLEVTPVVLERFPKVKIVILSMMDEEQFILHLIELGVHGYLLKNVEPEIVVKTIQEVMKQGTSFDTRIANMIHKNIVKRKKMQVSLSPRVHFTERDIEVIKLLCNDCSTDEIAEKLSLSPRTIEWYRTKLMEKTDSKNIAGVIAFSFKHNLVDL